MKNFRTYYLAFGAIVVLMACNNYDYQLTNSGVRYKIVDRGGKKLQPGQFVKVHYKALIGDSVLFNTYGVMPAFGQYDTTAKNVHDFVDFFDKLGVGDSAVFVRSVDTMQARGYLMFNEVFKKGGTIKGHITILKTYDSREAMMQDQQKEMEMMKERQIAGLEQYLKEQKIEGFIKTPKGVFVKIDVPGNGAKVDTGMLVSVNYTGKLKNGVVFDSNVDSSFGHVTPLEFAVGSGGVIEGWDEGIRYFKVGDKGRVFIPSMLGYGGNAQGEKLPAYSDLVFNLEILGVKPAPPAAASPMPIAH